MASKEDDTLPLPALSQELQVDVTADEDFIPTSQPQGLGSKVHRTFETNSNEAAEEATPSNAAPYAAIDDTLPREAVIIDQATFDKDKSSDFIPDTETKKTKITYAKDEPACKKKLPVFANDNPPPQSNPLWETQMPQIPESPAIDTEHFSVLGYSPVEIQPCQQDTPLKCDKSSTEIIVNDSAETVDLEGSPMKVTRPENEAKDVPRCEETQIFDNSSVLLLEQPGPSGADQDEKSVQETTSQNLYLVQTVDDNESEVQEQENLIVAKPSRNFLVKEEVSNVVQPKENAVAKGEPSAAVEEQIYVTTKKMDFKLTVTCFVTFNTKTNKVLQKFISKVDETPKSQSKSTRVERFSDNASDKSKRYSTSSSGSVYSDKHGLPFALPKRVSAVSDQTDSSEEDFGTRMKEKRKALGRAPWSNEYLLPLKLDELMLVSMETHQMLERPTTASPLRKPRDRRNAAHLKETLQSSSSEPKSAHNLENGEPNSLVVGNSAGAPEKETEENTPSALPEEDKAEGEVHRTVKRSESKERGSHGDDREEKSGEGGEREEAAPERSPPSSEAKEVVEGQKEEEEEEKSSLVALCDGLPVLARWTDKRYYSGVLCGSPKNDRWDVKFDDGTLKTVREDFIMPTEWLKAGALVFALVEDSYVSGQVVGVERGKEVTYAVELDVKEERVSAKVSDLCLTEVMAGIIREKYKPLAGTPRGGGKADIDFDNVLSGKRLREQKTPSRPPTTAQAANSEGKKRSSRVKQDDGRGLETIKETPEANTSGRRMAGLKSEGGHLVEDRMASTDSPSGNDVGGGTPVRRASREARGKAKPRSLSYEVEESRSGRGKLKSWLTPDGTPIPGPSGVKFKRKKTKPKREDSDEPPRKKVEQERSGVSRGTRSAKKSPGSGAGAVESPARGRRKRRLEEESVVEENVHRKSVRKADVRGRGKGKKG